MPADRLEGHREILDVLIVGAGLPGIGAAHHLQRRCPGKRYAITEARACIGGTWDISLLERLTPVNYWRVLGRAVQM